MVARAGQLELSDRDGFLQGAQERLEPGPRCGDPAVCERIHDACLEEHVTRELRVKDEAGWEPRKKRADVDRQDIEPQTIRVGSELGHGAPVRRATGHPTAALPVGSKASPRSGLNIVQDRRLRRSPPGDEIAERRDDRSHWIAVDHDRMHDAIEGWVSLPVDRPQDRRPWMGECVMDPAERLGGNLRKLPGDEQDCGGPGRIEDSQLRPEAKVLDRLPSPCACDREDWDWSAGREPAEHGAQAHSRARSRHA